MPRRIPHTESLQVEFKSDRSRLPDRELVLAAVCLANTEGGEIYLGVENDGTVTGLHEVHQNITGLAALIANRTTPPLSVRAEVIDEEGLPVARIEVPRSTRLVATADGTLQRRRLLADGTPECIPFLPHEFATRASDLRLTDYAALPVAGATLDDLDPVERQRLRQAVDRYRGDKALLDLDDEQLDGALGLTSEKDGKRVPTVAGLLLIGREGSLRTHLPTHEVALQVLEGTEVRVNDFYRWPLVRLFEQIDQYYRARVTEREVQVGLFRVGVPTLDERAFREAVVNALVHRDYTRLGAVHIQWRLDALTISNPGGFVEGVGLDNLLVAAPTPRNPVLADAFKRIGLAERTGRGVDLIFEGLLRYGRPAPDYGQSDRAHVAVELSCAEADLGFLEMVIEQEKQTGRPMPLDSLLVLSHLRTVRRVQTADVARLIQKPADAARAVLERLVEAGLVQAHGVKRGRTYTLSPAVYQQLGKEAEYTRQAGFSRIQQEQMVLNYVDQHGRIKRGDVMTLCQLGPHQATRLLKKMVKDGVLELHGERRWSYYERAS